MLRQDGLDGVEDVASAREPDARHSALTDLGEELVVIDAKARLEERGAKIRESLHQPPTCAAMAFITESDL